MEWGGRGILLELCHDPAPLFSRQFYSQYPVFTDSDHRAWLPPMTVEIGHAKGGWTTFEFRLRLWFLAASYTAGWLGTLIWWQHRKHRLMNASVL
ncbi:MAG: hypothetical protein EOP84_14590 [Verrucomicrobiaceae bacterium]|nr:MAG: hypothetical protein EOP84_14590 [Verrucomicrobiaceae bacterium]